MDPIVQPFIHKANKPETSSRLNPRAAEFTPFSQDPSTSFDLGTPSHSREPSLSSATTLSSSTTLVEQPPPIVSSASRQLPIIANTNQQPFMVTNPSWQRPFVNNAYWPWPYCPPAQYYTPYGPSPWNTPDYIKSSTPTDSGRPEHPAPVSEPPESTKRGRTGWPINHTPLQNSSYNSLHPSKIPDSAFFEGEQSNNSMAMEDPWKSGSFDPAATPVSSFFPTIAPSLAYTMHTRYKNADFDQHSGGLTGRLPPPTR